MSKKAFTLVELLVVIAIIALLMSILMPALARVKSQAKAVLCLANLNQWGLVFSLYTSDNDGCFMNGNVPKESGYWWEGGSGGGIGSWWFLPLKPYYKDPALRLCPVATKPYEDGGQVPFGAWQTPSPMKDTGSYGTNGYILNSPAELFYQLGRTTKFNWHTINVKGTGNIPLFLGCSWVDAWPHHTDEPTPFEHLWWRVPSGGEMRQFCCNRHNGFVNGVFFDFSVRPIGLKELWTLKWHRQFDTCELWTVCGGVQPTDWPQWMRRFKDY
jgi:prepilin-type N-terminal cleavage/methylation domain-containing protein